MPRKLSLRTVTQQAVKQAERANLLSAIPKGAGYAYSTFGLIAIYNYQGLWVIAPVALGASVSLSAETLRQLHEAFPNNKSLKYLYEASLFADEGIGGYLQDFGFAWSMVIATGVAFGGVQMATNNFARFVAPAAAALPALITRAVSYPMATHPAPGPGFFDTLSRPLRGTASTAVISGLLMQQDLIEEDSYMPVLAIALTGFMGFASGALRRRSPMLSAFLLNIIILVGENPSLALTVFSILNDIVAAENNDDLPYWFFWSNTAFSSIFLLLLTLKSTLMIPETCVNPSQNDEYTPIDDEESARQPEEAYFMGPAYGLNGDNGNLPGNEDDNYVPSTVVTP